MKHFTTAASIYHHTSKCKRAETRPELAESSEKWPPEWRHHYVKTYQGGPAYSLVCDREESKIFMASLGDSLLNRASSRNFDGVISLETFSQIIFYSLANKVNFGKGNYSSGYRTYPSAGARYPLEVYVVADGINGITQGLYHFRPDTASLEGMFLLDNDVLESSKYLNYPWSRDAAVKIFVTAVFSRTLDKYGERGYRYVILEAGHLVQNLLLSSSALGVKSCSLGGMNDEYIEDLIGIDGMTESFVCGLVLG
jgi:SagB-type dehydrogenase family enzyme